MAAILPSLNQSNCSSKINSAVILKYQQQSMSSSQTRVRHKSSSGQNSRISYPHLAGGSQSHRATLKHGSRLNSRLPTFLPMTHMPEVDDDLATTSIINYADVDHALLYGGHQMTPSVH